MMFGSMCVSVRSSGCVRNLQKNIYSEHTDKKYSPHLEQNISLPFSFPLPVKSPHHRLTEQLNNVNDGC